MYLTHTKTLFIEALRNTFDNEYDVPSLRDLHVSMEYPIKKQNYPSIWIDYEDASSLKNVGISHVEDILDENGEPTHLKRMRWHFGGWVQMTIAALTSLERDTIYDQLIRVLAFGKSHPKRSVFRETIEDNDLVAVTLDFDEIETRGAATVPGTPWQTDEFIYERSVAVQLIGEFVSDPFGQELVPLSKVIWEGYYDENDFDKRWTQTDYDENDPIVSGQYPVE